MGSDGRDRYVSQTRDHYRAEEVAARYHARQRGAVADRVLAALERRAVRRGVAVLGLTERRSVVDVPAGAGKLTALLASSGPYVAVDISTAMLAFLPAGTPRVVADAEHLPLRPSSADLVVCLRLLHRVPEEVFERIVAELVSCARRGIVLSYVAQARRPWAHRILRLALRREAYPAQVLTPERVATLVVRSGARVVADHSVSFGAARERVAAVALDGSR